MKNTKRALGRTERAVYDLIHTNALPTAAILALYRREVSALVAAGLVTRNAQGLRTVGATTGPATPPPAPTVFVPPPLMNLNVRVPPEVHEALELVGRKSDVVRAILAHTLPRLMDARTRGDVVDVASVISILGA